jgi:hypothetical protein
MVVLLGELVQTTREPNNATQRPIRDFIALFVEWYSTDRLSKLVEA